MTADDVHQAEADFLKAAHRLVQFGRQELQYKADEFFVQFQASPKESEPPAPPPATPTQNTQFDPLDDPQGFERSQVPEGMDIA